MFKGLAFQIAQYMRIEKKEGGAGKGPALESWKELRSFYFDMPQKHVFDKVRRDHFYEIEVRQVSCSSNSLITIMLLAKYTNIYHRRSRRRRRTRTPLVLRQT